MRPSSRIALVTCLAFAAAIFWPLTSRAQAAAAAPADDALNQAKSHFEAGKNAYNAGDYPTSIREFKAAEALRPSPILDFNIGLANEKLGKKRVAVKYYKRYLEGMPNATNRATVEASIADLERQIAAQPAPQPQQQPPQQVEQPSDMPPQQQPNQPPPTYSSYDPYASTAPAQPPPPVKKKSYWWVALIIIGGVGLLAGLIAYAVIATTPSTVFRADSSLLDFRAPPATASPASASQRSSGLGNVLFSF
jgi:tetratricopeptide (TPR) repeat protein